MRKHSKLCEHIKDLMNRRSYRELLQLSTFEERYKYLRLNGRVGIETFGFDRWLNQRLYKSLEWRNLRNKIIVRDEGCDLGILSMPCFGRAIVHHMNPVTEEELRHSDESIFDTDNLILCSLQTHNAIHYGDESKLRRDFMERRPNDTCLWK